MESQFENIISLKFCSKRLAQAQIRIQMQFAVFCFSNLWRSKYYYFHYFTLPIMLSLNLSILSLLMKKKKV